MKVIKKLVENISDILDLADRYAMCAMKNKDDDKNLAAAYAKLAEDELSHADILHKQIVRIITEYKTGGSEVPPAMQAVYDWEHEKMIDHATRVKTLLELYKTQ